MRKSISLFLVYILLASSMLVLTGCPNIQNDLNVAANVASSAATILRPVNPKIATDLDSVKTDLKLLGTLYAQYEAAPSSTKSSVAAELQKTITTITANLSSILTAVHIKNPELVEYITVGVAVINSAIDLILTKLPASATAAVSAAKANTKPLPTVPNAKNAKDLKKAWNDQVRFAYPALQVK